jgi:hypothetical protein
MLTQLGKLCVTEQVRLSTRSLKGISLEGEKQTRMQQTKQTAAVADNGSFLGLFPLALLIHCMLTLASLGQLGMAATAIVQGAIQGSFCHKTVQNLVKPCLGHLSMTWSEQLQEPCCQDHLHSRHRLAARRSSALSCLACNLCSLVASLASPCYNNKPGAIYATVQH